MVIAFIMTAVEDINTVTGVGQHQLNIVKGLMELSLEDNYVFLVNDLVEKQLLGIYPGIKTYSYGKQLKLPRIIKRGYYFFNLLYLNRIIISKAIGYIDPDVVFQPFNCITIKTRWKKPSALILLDLYHRFFPEFIRKAYYIYTVKRHDAMMRNSDLIITSSNENKSHVGQFYPEALHKVEVIPVPIEIDTEAFEPVDIGKPYILCVNSLRYHKNIHTLIKAFNLIKDRVEHNLVLIGTTENDEKENIKSKSDRIIFTGYISSSQRNYLYREADLFVSPTMFEGFGMTPLEAMLFEKKVLVSDIPVMREANFGSVEYFGDIENEEILSNRLIEVLDRNYTDKQLKDVKKQVLEKYNPTRIALQIHMKLTALGGINEDCD